MVRVVWVMRNPSAYSCVLFFGFHNEHLRVARNRPFFSQEKAKNLYGMKNLNSYELTIEPRLADTTNCDVRPSMSAADLLNRRHKFHHNLINLLRKQHTK